MKPELAGKRVKCKCGGRIQFPALEEELTEADLLDAAPAPSARKPKLEALEQPTDSYSTPASAPVAPPPMPATPPCVNCKAPLTPGAVICMRCGTNQRTGRSVQTQVVQGLPKAKPAPTSSGPVDDSLSTTDWLLILFCGPVAFIMALVRGLSGQGWRMMITIIVVNAICTAIGVVLGVIMALTGGH